jgi:hypothetical protein
MDPIISLLGRRLHVFSPAVTHNRSPLALTSASPPMALLLSGRIPGSGLIHGSGPGPHFAVRRRGWSGVRNCQAGDVGAWIICRRLFGSRAIAGRRLGRLFFILSSPRRSVRAATLTPVLGLDRGDRRIAKRRPVEPHARILCLEGVHHVIIEGLPANLHVWGSTKPVQNAFVRLPTTPGNRFDQVKVLVPAPVSRKLQERH